MTDISTGLADTPRYAVPSNALHRKFLFLVATTTPQKIFELNAIARQLKLPMHFVSLKEFTNFRSAEEDKSNRIGNSAQKFDEVKPAIRACQTDPRYTAALHRLCGHLGIAYDPQNTFAITDDGTVSLEKNIWEAIRPVLQRDVPEPILESAEQDTYRHKRLRTTFVGPAAEFGPIVAATTQEFFNTIRRAIPESRDTAPRLLQQVTVFLHRLADPLTHKPHLFDGRALFDLAADAAAAPMPDSGKFTTPDHHMVIPGTGRPISEQMELYFLRMSARTRIVEQLYSHAVMTRFVVPKITQDITTATSEALGQRLPTIRCIAPALPNLKSFEKRTRSLAHRTAKNIESALTLEENFRNGDAFIYMPSRRHGIGAVLRDGYTLACIDADKQLEARGMNRPTLIVNDGSLDDYFLIRAGLVDQGMLKEFNRHPVFETQWSRNELARLTDKLATRVSLARFTSTSYYDRLDVPQDTDPKQIGWFINDLLKARIRETPLGPIARQPGPSVPSQPPQSASTFNVAVLLSATNDNLGLLHACNVYGAFLAQNQLGLVWGAGDRHAMGRIYEAYTAHNGIWCEGYSTESIIVSETRRGEIPRGAHYGEICPDIFARMAKLFERAQAVCVMPGGIGTLQELLAFLLLKDRHPELVENKPLIIYNPKLHACDKVGFWDKTIETYIGKGAVAELRASLDAFGMTGKLSVGGAGIYMAETAEQLAALTAVLAVDSAPEPVMQRTAKAARKLAP